MRAVTDRSPEAQAVHLLGASVVVARAIARHVPQFDFRRDFVGSCSCGARMSTLVEHAKHVGDEVVVELDAMGLLA